MGTLSLSLPSDGQTIDAADVNVPFNAIAAVINGDIDSANIEAGGVVPNALTSGTGTTWAWQTWTPTLSGLFDDSKWTKTAKYIQIGKTVHFRMTLVASTTTPMSGSGDAIFTLPVTSVALPGTANKMNLGTGSLFDATGGTYHAAVVWASTTTAALKIYVTDAARSAQAAITSADPFTWTTSDEVNISGFFEAP